MKGIAAFSGKPDSVHLVDLPEPSIDDILDGRVFLVEAPHIGSNAADAKTDAAEYAEALRGTTSWSSTTSRSSAYWTQGAHCDGC